MSKHKKLGDNIVGLSSIFIVLSLFSIAIVFAVNSYSQARENLINDIDVLSKLVGNRSAAALIFQDVKAAEVNLNSINFNENVLKACIYTGSLTLFAAYSVDQKLDACQDVIWEFKNRIISGTRNIAVTNEIEDSGDRIGFISIYANTDKIEQSLQNSLLTSFFALLIIIPVVLWFLNRKLRKTLSPLIDLHNTALTISQNPFSSLRANRDKNDEVGRLVDVFNSMLDTLDRDNQALLTSESRFRSLAENSPVGIYQMDESRRFTYTNDKWQMLTGLKAGIENKDYLHFLSDDEQNLYLAVLDKVQSTGKAQVIEYNFSASERGENFIFMEHIAPIGDSTSDDKEFKGFIGSLLDISELKDAQLELENLAFYDPLTGLPNRRFFMDHLKFIMAGAHNEQNRIAILMLDLDDFKKVNDTLGHDAGDQLLIILAERLRSVIAKKDVVSRMGGDEFLIILKDSDINASIQKIADRMLLAISRPVSIMGQDIEVTSSIGVSIYPEDGKTPETLIRNADLALYLSKENGRNRLSFFSKKLETVIHEKVRMERKIRDAIKNEAFTFHVQPQWCLASKQLISGEVLIRWLDEGGFIGPNIFIPIAEDSGLITEIGDWLIENVIKSISENMLSLKALGLNYLAINLSAKQFFNNQLVNTIRRHLEYYKVDPNMLEFELTESAVMEDTEQAIEIMRSLRELGCRLSIDDFGTGYSSLSYLKKFPINAVKIDQSFISDIPNDQNDIEISSAIIVMGHSLGLDVIAEGVETKEQLDFLIEKSCDYAQGYFVAKPMPFSDLLSTAPQIIHMMNNLS